MAYTYRLLLVTCILALFSCRQPHTKTMHPGAATKSEVAEVWPALHKEVRPWTRWWWMGSAVDEKNIDKLLKEYAAAGFGGVEIAPIYGAMSYESRYLEYLSPEWMNMLHHTVQKAAELEMGVDMTQGTGWPFGGPFVTPAHAASKLFIQTYKLSKGQVLQESLVPRDAKQLEAGAALQAVMAYNDKGEKLDVTGKVSADGKLNWKPASENWTLYAVYNGRTRQMVKRAAPGGVGYTLNHLSSEAAKAYLHRFDQAFNGDTRGVRAFYNDSYEVYGADWSGGFFEEFEKRRGYDLKNYLQELLSEGRTEAIARLKSDYRETMAEMLLENFTQRWSDWAHKNGNITKNQAHGSPGNLLDLYAAVDIPEGETFGSSYFPIPGLRRDSADIRNVDPDPVMMKFASSGAHASGRNLVSSETFTWLGEHFKTSFSQCKPEVEQVFLAGVNHVFYHGVTYSPEDVAWPGWLFYASLNLTPANSLWPHLSGMNNYIARCQSVLQEGQADNEVMVYWPVYDFWQRAAGRESLFTVHAIDEWLHPTPFYKQVKLLMERGYSLDFVSDKMLASSKVEKGHILTAPAAPKHKVLLIPQARLMPLSTLEHIIRLAKEGATVIMEELPLDVPGMGDLDDRRKQFEKQIQLLSFTDAGNGVKRIKIGDGQLLLSKDTQKALTLAGVEREALVDTGLKFIRRAISDGKYYYLVNHTAKAIDTHIPLNIDSEAVVIMDPQQSDFGLAHTSAANNKTQVRVQMQPGEALILRASGKKADKLLPWKYLAHVTLPIEITGEWTLKFTQGGPELPGGKKLSELVSWTELPNTKLKAFSGSGEYSITFDLPSKKEGEYVLDLGRVNESAKVWINGQEVGILWSIPFQARVSKFLKSGKNTLKIEVANLMANRIRDMDRKGIEWRKYHEINFVNINYKPFNAAGWQLMPSGLLGPVKIIPYVNTNL